MNNLISNDPLVTAIFEAVVKAEAESEEKLKAVIRAGKIAEAYQSGGTAFTVAERALSRESSREYSSESH